MPDDDQKADQFADQFADQIKAYLADRDAPCPGCGYNLRGAKEPVCPECNTAIVLSVGDPTPGRQLWWFAMVCATTVAVGEGVTGAFSFAVIIQWGLPASRSDWVTWLSAAGQCAVAIVAAAFVVILLSRRRTVGARGLRLMLIIAALYGASWVALSLFWAVDHLGWW